MEKECNDLLGVLKREKGERERDSNLIKERIDNERKELQISIDKDRENVGRRLAEEHDMRRLEQMEMQQRLDNNEKSGKNDITEIFNKMKREQEAREIESDEIRNSLNNAKSNLEEKILREKQVLFPKYLQSVVG